MMTMHEHNMNHSLFCAIVSIFQNTRFLRAFLFSVLMTDAWPGSHLHPTLSLSLSLSLSRLVISRSSNKRMRWSGVCERRREATLDSRGLPGVSALVTKQNREDYFTNSTFVAGSLQHSPMIFPDPLLETRKIISVYIIVVAQP